MPSKVAGNESKRKNAILKGFNCHCMKVTMVIETLNIEVLAWVQKISQLELNAISAEDSILPGW